MSQRRDVPREVVLYEARLEPIRQLRAGYSQIEGRAVPYGAWTNRGWFMESIAEGALDKSIEEAASQLPLLVFHNAETWPIGVSTDWDSRRDGLWGVWRLDDSEEAQRAARLADEGMMRWFSIAISPIQSKLDAVADDAWDPAKGPDFMDRITRLEARLLETSLVTTPAFGQAQVTLVHTSERPEAYGRAYQAHPKLDAWRAELERIRASSPVRH